MRRHELRRRAVQALYQIDVGKAEIIDAVNHVFESDPAVADTDLTYVNGLVKGTRVHIDELDELLSQHVHGWTLDRIAKVELNVLRLALYELLYETDVDVATIMDEAVELAKAFSTDESGKFVNGVLAKLLPAVSARRGQVGV